ncbi:nucleoside hydrolase [Micromonospora sp. NPDC048170]|uniref:nucleoside hydrolase n=1 Tax=Micromonospora sp. NPDC048170 TaxID=3154819 RepID=UPI0033C983CB
MPHHVAGESPIPIVLDTDLGTDVDDLLALIVAATDARLDLRAVTTVNGDTVLRARIARAVLDMLGRTDVPVGAGARVGLSGQPHETMPNSFGHEGRGVPLPPVTEIPPATEVLADVLGAAGQPVTLCAVGALTNVAQLLMGRPDLLDHVAGVHLLGGCLAPIRWGRVLLADADFAEYNVSCDPLALFALLAMPVPMRIAPIDVTASLRPTSADRRAIADASWFGRFVDEQIAIWLEVLQERLAASGRRRAELYLHDPLVVAALADPALITCEMLRVAARGTAGKVSTIISADGRVVEAVRQVDTDGLRKAVVRGVCAASLRAGVQDSRTVPAGAVSPS